MRTYKSTLNDLKRLNQLTKTGRNWSFPVDFPHPHPLEVICKSLPLQCRSCSKTDCKCMQSQTMPILSGASAIVGAEIVFPAACSELVWPVQPSPASGMWPWGWPGLACLSSHSARCLQQHGWAGEATAIQQHCTLSAQETTVSKQKYDG